VYCGHLFRGARLDELHSVPRGDLLVLCGRVYAWFVYHLCSRLVFGIGFHQLHFNDRRMQCRPVLRFWLSPVHGVRSGVVLECNGGECVINMSAMRCRDVFNKFFWTVLYLCRWLLQRC